MPDAILGRSGPTAPRDRPGGADPAPAGARRRSPRGWEEARVRALLSVANRDGHRRASRATCAPSTSRSSRPTARASTSPADGVEVASRQRPDPGPAARSAARSRPSIHAVYAGHPGPARRARAAGRARAPRASASSTSSSSTSSRSRRRSASSLVGIDEAIEMIDVGGAALLGAAARNAAGVAAASRPGHYPTIVEEMRAARPRQPGAAGHARGGGVQHGRGLPRGDRRLPQPDRGQHVPEPARDGPREGRRPALWREPAPARGVLSRDHAPQRARWPTRPSSRATGRRSTTCSTSTRRTGSRRDYTAPTVAIVKHTDPVGLASNDELVEAYRHALETDPVASFGGIVGRQPRAGRGDGPGDRRQLVRGGRRARVQPGRARDPAREGGPRAAGRPARPDRGDARLRHRQPRLQARRRRPARRDPRRARARPQPAPGRHPASTRRSRSSRTCCSRGAPSATSARMRSSSPATARPSGSAPARRRARSRSRSRCGARAIAPSSRSWPRTPTSRSPTGSSSRPGPA